MGILLSKLALNITLYLKIWMSIQEDWLILAEETCQREWAFLSQVRWWTKNPTTHWSLALVAERIFDNHQSIINFPSSVWQWIKIKCNETKVVPGHRWGNVIFYAMFHSKKQTPELRESRGLTKVVCSFVKSKQVKAWR